MGYIRVSVPSDPIVLVAEESVRRRGVVYPSAIAHDHGAAKEYFDETVSYDASVVAAGADGVDGN
jgi:hypothetical protein